MASIHTTHISILAAASVFFLLFTSAASAVGIGAAPGAQNFGVLERGKTYPFTFYLLTNTQNPVLTGLKFKPPRRSLYHDNQTGALPFNPHDASEESIADWVVFPREQVVVDPDTVETIRFPNGDIVNANQDVPFRITVPEDAEPGLHAFSVALSPKLSSSGGGGIGVGAVGIARPVFAFRVPGEAHRSGKVTGIAASRNGDRARFDVLFRNTGTVTVTARVSRLEVYNETGHFMTAVESGPQKVRPGETQVFKTVWIDENDEERKRHRVEATVDYLTGAATKEAMVTVPRHVEEETKPEEEAEKRLPLWLIVLVTGFVFLLTYYRWSANDQY